MSSYASLIHLYDFEDGTCNDKIATTNGRLFNDAYISQGKLIFTNQYDYMQLPSDIFNYNTSTSTSNIIFDKDINIGSTIEVFLTIKSFQNNPNVGFARIFQFGKYNDNNSFSLALDRNANRNDPPLPPPPQSPGIGGVKRQTLVTCSAADVRHNKAGPASHFNTIMFEYFPWDCPADANPLYQAYSYYRFNNNIADVDEQQLYIVMILSPGSNLQMYINNHKYTSQGAIPFYKENDENNIYKFNYFGKSLDQG